MNSDFESKAELPVGGRRRFLATLCVPAFLIGSSGVASASNRRDSPIVQPEPPNEAGFMQRAIEMRQVAIDQGDQAYGAVVVRDGVIVGQSWSRVILDHDPTGHAEMAAIRDAAKRLRDRNLRGSIIYSSSRPCPMCEAAAYWSGISEMVYGRGLDRAGPPDLCG
ncbi:MAG: nucleoside deaminase [Rhizobiaceae bacterium]